MSIRKRDVHFSDWTKVRHALVCNNVQGITETSSFDDVRAFLINSESGLNPFYYYVCYIKETKEIYTHGQFYAYSKSSYDDTELRNLIGTKADLSALESLVSEVEENEEVTAAALTELHENKADKSEIPDVSEFATKDELNTLSAEVDNKVDSSSFTRLSETVSGHTTSIANLGNNKADKTSLNDYVLKSTYNARVSAVDDALDLKADKDNYYTKTESDDKYATKTSLSDYAKSTDLETAKTDLNSKINLKQDKLTSGTNIKTVNGNSILGSGNIETPDTKVTSAANHYGYNTNNATSTTGAFVTKITKDAANHVTSFESRALTSTDIPGLDASKITSGTIDIARLPKGALEQLHHYENKELAQQAVIDKAVQLGDTVQINNATMYICTNDSATTFATQFTEYVAGTAASVPWSGITGKPTGIDEWGNRIGVIESGYATQSWVGENYLPLTGGTLTSSDVSLNISRVSNTAIYSTIGYMLNGTLLGYLGFDYNGELTVSPNRTTNSAYYSILHEGNLSSFKLSQFTDDVVTGKYLPLTGGEIAGLLQITRNPAVIKFNTTSNTAVGYLGFNADDDPVIYKADGKTFRHILHTGNYSTYALPLSGGTLSGALIFNGTSSTAACIKFLRQNYNYITWPQDYSLAFAALEGEATPGSVNTVCRITKTSLVPERDNEVALGASSQKWSNVYATKFTGNLVGNANSATKLTTARTIWGQSFDGTKNIAGQLSEVTTLYGTTTKSVYLSQSKVPTSAGYLGTAIGFGLNSDNHGIYIWGTANGVGHIQVGRSDGTADVYGLCLQEFGGNVAIGGTTADEKLHIHGNVKASGSMYATDFCTTSDNRLKDFTKDVIVDFNELKNIPKKYYYWKDKSMGEELQIGTSAQELAKVYPECVSYNEKEDRYSVNYQKLSIIALAAIDKLHERISVLEKKLNDQNS